ncbi:hypothetical protein GCM10011531_07250 [Aquaticitalea lipolytica]|uniref:Uncharacterized protein n=1 Tax=Aquaticitalea lipolytica TaxID=1247562 RepID=A0A8J2TT71_9FLAO|nr:hypothetical protein GCM10011531_07250 [Aquaticitalea lipolytica]
MRFFSSRDNPNLIKVCIKDSVKIIPNADLNGQAQEKYFYGKDLERENWFGNIEDKTSNVLKKVVKTKQLPKDKSDDYYWIWLFMLLQAYRTRANADEFNEMVDSSLKTAMKFEKKFEDFEFDNYSFAHDDAIEISLDILLKSLPMLLDMQIKLLKNDTNKELITSDNPISKYNQFLESRKFPYGHTGIMSKGLQIFYPLSPDLLLTMYDPRVYKVGNKKQFSNILMNAKDIEFLNILTCLHSNKSVFSSEKVSDFQLEQILEKSKKYQDQKELKTKNHDSITNKDGTHSVTVQHHRNPFMINLNLSFLKQTQHAKSYKLTGYYAEIRNERYRNAENRPTLE